MAQISLAASLAVTIQSNSSVAAASNASPVSITTSANHGLNSGDLVFVAGVTGNSGANGQWVITKTGATTFTLNNSTGNAAYVSGGTVVHLGRCTPALSVDNSVFSRVPVDWTFRFRLEALNAGNARAVLYDTADTFVTELPAVAFQVGVSQLPNNPAEYVNFFCKRADSPALRLGSSGNSLRVKFFLDAGAGTTFDASAWLEY